MMKRVGRLLSLLLCAAMLWVPVGAAEGTGEPDAGAPVLLRGQISRMEGEGRLLLAGTQEGAEPEMVLHLTENTLSLDAASGEPVALADIANGTEAAVYVGPAMTASLPPQSTAVLILTGLPANGVLPALYTVTTVEMVDDTGITVSTDQGELVRVRSEATVTPYLTKNIVTYRDLTPGVQFLVWRGSDGVASRVLLLTNPGLPFTDVAESSYAYGAVSYVTGRGILQGTSTTTFSPDRPLTRAQAMVALYRIAGSPEMTQTVPEFSDVPAGASYAAALTWAVGNRIVSGYSDQTFRPHQAVTREQLAVFLYRWEQHQGGGFQGAWTFLLNYSDRAEIGQFAYEGVAWCTMNGILAGRADGTLGPKQTVTRAAASVMLQRYLEMG